MCLTLEEMMNSWAYIYFNPGEKPPRSHWWYPTYRHLRALNINTELGCSFWTGMVNRLDFNYQKLVLPGFLNHQPSRVFKSKVSFWVDENSSDGHQTISQYNKLGTSQEYPVNHKVFWFSLKGHFFHFSILQYLGGIISKRSWPWNLGWKFPNFRPLDLDLNPSGPQLDSGK